VSSQRFTPEFKEEAVRQVVERGYGVPDVAARLGVSAHSLYKWVKAVSPNRSELFSDNHDVRCRQPPWPVGLTEDGHARL